MITVPEVAFASKVLDRELHERLIADMDSICNTAGVPPFVVWTRMSMYCSPQEMDWVAKSFTKQTSGLVFVGKQLTPVEDRMMAMTAAYLRNFKDARMLTLQEVLHLIKTDRMPLPTVLLIPNFCVGKTGGGDIPSWQTAGLLGLLYQRMSHGLKTILYVESLDVLTESYGASFTAHLKSHYDFF